MRTYFIHFLESAYLRQREANPRFSKHAFARKLGLDPALLIALLAGRRKPTVKMAQKILSRMKLENPFQEEALILSVVAEKFSPSEGLPQRTEKDGEYPSSWLDHAVQVLLKPSPHRNSKAEVAANLGVSQRQLAPVLARMERQGFLKQERHTVVLLDGGSYFYKGEGNKDLDKLQMEYIMKSIQAYDKNAEGPLKIMGTTFTCNPEKLTEGVKLIREFVWKLGAFLEDPNSKYVYRLNTQLFPLTQLSAEESALLLRKQKKQI